MKRLSPVLRAFGVVTFLGLVSLALLPLPAHAGGVHVSFGFGLPAPVLVAPQPVYVPPAPVVVARPAVVYAPAYYGYHYGYWRHHHHGYWRHHHHGYWRHHHHRWWHRGQW